MRQSPVQCQSPVNDNTVSSSGGGFFRVENDDPEQQEGIRSASKVQGNDLRRIR
jgi:hypothetical protein